MKKVVHLITGLDVGGAETMLRELLPQMNNLRHFVYCIKGHGSIGTELQKESIPVTYLEYNGPLSIFSLVHKFISALKKDRPTLLVTYLIHADLFGRIIAPFAGINKIVSFKHGALLQWEFLKYIDRATKFLVMHYISISNILKNKLIKDLNIPPSHVTVIQNGVNIHKFAQKKESPVRKEFGIPNETIVIGIIANLRKGKGHNDLIKAFSKLKKTKNPIKLLIVGMGDQTDSLKTLTNNFSLTHDIIFTDHRNDIPDILGAIDIIALPTYFEGMSVALLEAMAAKKPIITTSIPENLEILTHDKTALLFIPGDIDTLEKYLNQLIHQKSFRDALAENAYTECHEKYNIDKTIATFEKKLLELCA